MFSHTNTQCQPTSVLALTQPRTPQSRSLYSRSSESQQRPHRTVGHRQKTENTASSSPSCRPALSSTTIPWREETCCANKSTLTPIPQPHCATEINSEHRTEAYRLCRTHKSFNPSAFPSTIHCTMPLITMPAMSANPLITDPAYLVTCPTTMPPKACQQQTSS
jgi:hypothetical protein